MPKVIDTDGSLLAIRCGEGIQLVKPESLPDNAKLYPSISDLLNLEANVYFLNPESKIININDYALNALNFPSRIKTINNSIRLVAKRETADYCLTKDFETIQTNKMNISEENFYRLDDFFIQAISFKYPWYNADKKTIGLISICLKLDNKQPEKIVNLLTYLISSGLLKPSHSPEKIDSILPGRNINKVYLSARELDCLKLLIRGKSAKASGQVLGLSPRTVESYLENIKLKFNVSKKSDLIEAIFESL